MAEGDRAEREESLRGLLARASHLVSAGFYEPIEGHRLPATTWRVLAALAERDGVTMTELADLALLKQPTLTKTVDRMERDKLVRRRIMAEDRRCALVSLTERGRRAAALVVLRARRRNAAVALAIGKTAHRRLKSALLALIGRLPNPEAGN